MPKVPTRARDETRARDKNGVKTDAYLQRGRGALESGQWTRARRHFRAALKREENPEALEGLGMAAWWLDDAETVFDARERAYRLYRKRRDGRGASRVAIALAEDFLYFRGEPAVSRGWHRRASDLLAALPRVPEHGWLKIIEGDFALTVGSDPEAARACAADAAVVGRALGVVDLEMVARALEGAAFVAEGRLAEGMARLDEAATAAVSGELSDPIAIGYSCCYLLVSCERVRDFDRAAQWCGRVKEFSKRARFNALLAICRTQYASLLIGCGEWADAEQELLAASREFAKSRPAVQAEALVRLAGLRRRQGRFEETASLLAGLDGHPLALLEQAALALDGGEAGRAARLAERFLRQIPEQNRLDRLTAMDVVVRATAHRADVAGAAAALDRLRAAADGTTTAAVRAAVASAEGLVARTRGDTESARRAFEDAVDLFGRSGAVFDAARTRLELAITLCELGHRDDAAREAQAAVQGFEGLGASAETRRGAALLKKLLSDGEAKRMPRPGGLSRREVDVLRFVAQGLSNQAIASQLHVSGFTVKRHVQNILTKLDLPSRAAAAAYATRHGIA